MSKPQQDREECPTSMTGRQTYNVVADVVGGVNVRRRDNLFQAAAIFVLGTGIGAAVVQERVAGALVGGFIGLLAGLFGSGLVLMIYRAVMHLRGRHD